MGPHYWALPGIWSAALQEAAPRIGIGACRHPCIWRRPWHAAPQHPPVGAAVHGPAWRPAISPRRLSCAGCPNPRSLPCLTDCGSSIAPGGARRRPDDSPPPLELASCGIRHDAAFGGAPYRRNIPPLWAARAFFADLARYLRCGLFGPWGARGAPAAGQRFGGAVRPHPEWRRQNYILLVIVRMM